MREEAAGFWAVHTATGGRCPVARHITTSTSVHTTARARRMGGNSTHLAEFCEMRPRRTLPFNAPVEDTNRSCVVG